MKNPVKIWVDDVRQAPDGYVWCRSVNETIAVMKRNPVDVLDMDHDAGDYAKDGGDYIRILDWLESHPEINPPTIRIHSMNPVGVENMRRIIQKNGWIEAVGKMEIGER